MRRRHERQHGFTLIEIAVVLVLMALLAATVALGSRGMIGGATREDILSQIESIDASARQYAQQTQQPVRLEVDRFTQRLTLSTPDRPDVTPLPSYQLPRGYLLENTWKLHRGERISQNPLVLTYDPQGWTSTWGLALKSPTRSSDEPPETDVLLVLGATGQTTRWESDESAQDILAEASRRDTD